MVRNRVLDDLEKFFLRIGALDGEAMEKLNHQTSKPFEGSRDTDGGGYFDQNPLGGLDVDLQLPGLIDRRIKKRKQALA